MWQLIIAVLALRLSIELLAVHESGGLYLTWPWNWLWWEITVEREE